ncbi:MAG: hypothetical protein KDJ16_16070, partial [Hyphomicrobiales bacterium]|nr:hypothetical protein [Hyphomicrobiales bacterium]
MLNLCWENLSKNALLASTDYPTYPFSFDVSGLTNSEEGPLEFWSAWLNRVCRQLEGRSAIAVAQAPPNNGPERRAFMPKYGGALSLCHRISFCEKPTPALARDALKAALADGNPRDLAPHAHQRAFGAAFE